MSRVKSRWFATGLILVLGGCGGAGAVPASDLALRTALECEVESYPEVVPHPELLVDTGALNRELRTLKMVFPTGSLRGRQIAMSLAYQEDGMNVRRDILTHDTEPSVADSIQQLVFAHRRKLPESDREWGVRLVIDLDERPTYRVEHREYCPPQPRNREIESAISTYIGTGLRHKAGSRVRTVVLRVLVHPSGHVEQGVLIRGGTSGGSFERDLVTYLRQFSFEPATIDGAPAYGHLDIPIEVRG